MKKLANTNVPAETKAKTKTKAVRAVRRVPDKSSPAGATAGTSSARPIPTSILTLKAAALPTPPLGTIKLAFPMAALNITSLVHTIGAGLKDNLNYPDFQAWEATLLATEGALIASMDAVTTAESMAKAARTARDVEVLNAENTLRNAALACEVVDRRDEALVSAGWSLRRAAGGPKPLPAPARIAMKNLPYEGQVEVRWGAVTNKRYYEVQAITGGPDPANHDWETLPTVAEGRVNKVFTGLPIGSYLSVRVRAIGSRGPSPWTEIATLRVN